MTSLDDYKFDSDRLGVGEMERAFLSAQEQVHGHPERKALANLYNGLALLAFAAVVAAAFCVPAVIWWAYSAATR